MIDHAKTKETLTTTTKFAKPLENRTIVVTRARAQASEFIEALERDGARVILCPTIEIIEPESYAQLDEAIENLYGYDWLIFTSVNGADYFLRRLKTLDQDANQLDELRVCAIGEATFRYLREARVHVDVVPQESKAEGIFASLELYIGGHEKLAGLRFLIPRAAVARDYLPRSLEAAGARVDVATAYRTMRPDTSMRGRIEALITGGAIDCIAFTSASTIKNFAQLFDTADLRELLNSVDVACIGEITAAAASELNLCTDIQPRETTTEALAQAISLYYAAHHD